MSIFVGGLVFIVIATLVGMYVMDNYFPKKK
jgi:hypothetical protein